MKLTLTFPGGQTATIEDGGWQSDNATIAAALNAQNVGMGPRSYLPHPYLHVAELYVGNGAVLTTSGEDDSAADDIN